MTTEEERTGIPITKESLQAQIQDLITQAEKHYNHTLTLDERLMLTRGYARFILTAIDTYIRGSIRHTEPNPITGAPANKSDGSFFGINFKDARREEHIDSFHYDLGEEWVLDRAASAHYRANKEHGKE